MARARAAEFPMVLRVFASVLALLVATGWAFGQATEPPPASKPAAAKPAAKPKPKTAAKPTVPRAAAPATTGAAPDTKPEQSTSAQIIKDSYAALTLSERLSIQSDLVWTGDYNGLVNGEFSDRLVAAVKAFQKRNKSKDTGVLNLQERASLSASAKPLQSQVGWRLVEDPVSGARIGLPGKLVPIATRGASGTRWSSQQGQFQIETFRISNTKLEAAYERQRREPFDRRPAYNVLRPDFFVISGMQGLKKFYVRASAQDNEVRGITILYDQAEEGTMEPVVVAMSSAFTPFAQLGALQEGVPSRRKVEYGTGLVVSGNGHVVTDKQIVDGCSVITIPGIGHAEQLAEDKTSELVLLRVYGARDLVPLGLLGAPARGDAVTLLGISDPQSQGGGAAVSNVAAKIAATGNPRPLDAVPSPGFSGAAAVDAQGRPHGMVVLKTPVVVAGPAQAPQAAVVPLDRLINFLEANYVAPSSSQPGADIKASVVRVICVRK
jgi:peptidoglycan hydrolase-like protein with peptidoglycan-binding domain